MKKRINWIDVLRFIGVLSIITIHIVGNTINTFYLGGSWGNIYVIISSLCEFAIPLFVMISGMMWLRNKPDKEKLKQHIIKILFGIVVVGYVYSAMEILYRGNASLDKVLIEPLLRVLTMDTWAHMWYLYMLLPLYLLTPLLKKLVDKLDKDNYIILLMMSFLLFVVLHERILMVVSIPFFDLIYKFLGYLFYYLFGYFIYREKVHKYYRYATYTGAAVSVFYLINLAISSGDIKSVSYISLPAFLIASTFIFLLKDKKFEHTNTIDFITSVGICSYGIYLIHQLFINIIYKVLVLDAIAKFPIFLPVYVSIVFLVSYATVYLLRKNKFISKYII